MACQSTFKFLSRWAKRVIFSYILFVLLFTCPFLNDAGEKDVDHYICRTGDGIHDLMLDSPLYPLWTKVIDPSIEAIRKKAYPLLKKASRRFEKNIKPLVEKTTAEGQVYLQAAHEKVLELHELHLAPTVQKIKVETDKVYQQYKPTVEKHASNIHSTYKETVKPHIVKHSSTLFGLIKSNTPKPVYEKIEYIDYFVKNELNLSTSTIPTRIHGFLKYQFLPGFYLRVNNVFNEIKNFYEPHEKNFHSSPAGSFYKEKSTAFNTMRKDPESLFHKVSSNLCRLYDTTSTLLYKTIDGFLSDPADLETEENVASAFFHKSQVNSPSDKNNNEPLKKTDSIKKTVKSAASVAKETLASVADSALPKETSNLKKAASDAANTLSETAESAVSAASENLATVTNRVLPKETSDLKKSASKATDKMAKGAKSVASEASETLASFADSVLPKETPDLKKAASKASAKVSDGAESVASAASAKVSDGAESVASAASETIDSVTSSALPKETENVKSAASKAADVLSESAESVVSNIKPKSKDNKIPIDNEKADSVQEKPKVAAKKVTKKEAKTENVKKASNAGSAEPKVKKPSDPKAKKASKPPTSEEVVQKDSMNDEL